MTTGLTASFTTSTVGDSVDDVLTTDDEFDDVLTTFVDVVVSS